MLVFTLLAGVLPVQSAQAATRINITSLYVTSNSSDLVNGKPRNDALIPRVTSETIDVLATIEGISDSQIADLFVEITNMNTNQRMEEKGIKAQKISDYDVIFRGIPLTEGLNRVVVKLGDTSVVESAPGWVYYTAATNISDLKINGEDWTENEFYPKNPEQSTLVNISGKAPNAYEVQAYLYGDASPITGYYNLGEFFFLADDWNKSATTANLRLKPGDNLIKLMALNNTKSYQIERKLIYDNGGPFAFNASISSSTDSKQPLILNPTVTSPSVTVDALLKIDQTSSGGLQYRYVEVLAGGKRFGPYDLGGAKEAEQAADLYPKTVYQGHSALEFTLQGRALQNVDLYLQDNAGTFSEVKLDANPASADGTLRTYKLSATGVQALEADKSPYKLIAKKTGETVPLRTFSVNVIEPTVQLPKVDDAKTAITGVNLGNISTVKQKIYFTGTFDDSRSYSVEFTNAEGTSILGTGSGYSVDSSDNSLSFQLPAFLAAGTYKFRFVYAGYPVMEKQFTVGALPQQAPEVASVITDEVLGIAGAGKTYLFVNGNHFGTDISNVTAKLISSTETIPLKTYDVSNQQAVFELEDQGALSDSTYDLEISVGSLSVTEPNAISVLAGGNDGKTVSDVRPLQLSVNELSGAGNAITVQGANLDGAPGQLAAQVLRQDGTYAGAASISSLGATSAVLSLPSLQPGTYILQLVQRTSGDVVLAQYPLAIADPQPSSLSPNIRYVNEGAGELTLTGTGFGRDPQLLKLRFESDATGHIVAEKTAKSIINTTAAVFDAPTNLAEGTYTVTVLYNNAQAGSTMQYTVASPPAELRENSRWSKPGDYRVYDFTANLDLTSDRVQQLQFRFYNLPSDNVQSTSFTFYYENPNLPYIEYVEMNNAGSMIRLNEGSNVEVNEQPATFYIYTNDKTKSLNYYVGDYTSVAPKDAGDPVAVELGGKKYHRFTVQLIDLPNGVQHLTFVPSAAETGGSHTGENPAGRKTFTLNVSSTPYVIINNMYHGMVIQNIAELSCLNPQDQTQWSGCIQGRLINVPETDYEKVEVIINGEVFRLKGDDFKDPNNPNVFYFRFGPNTDRPLQSGDLLEGKNTIRFVIYRGGQPVTEATFDLFKFSTSAPEFLSIRPVETGDLVKYHPANVPNSYVTNEPTVQFSGQFANASEITLTVRKVDPDTGEIISSYDRRFGSSFNLYEPSTNNPAFFQSIDARTGQFTTRPITLTAQGDTVFEFTITNSTNISVIETITITREPLPYVIISPKLTKNAKGEDQANINSNFYEIELEAENADAVMFGKEPAVKRVITDPSTGIRKERYFYEVRDLKNGSNKIKFTVVRGDEEIDGEFILYNVNTPVEGAQYKTPIKNKIKVFDGQIEVSFPRGTNLMRNDPSSLNQFITTDRQILFGIADGEDGRVDKYKHPAPYDGQIGNPNPMIPSDGRLLLSEPTGRFRPASPLYWIDAGTISKNETDLHEAYNGSGRLPYDDVVFYNRQEEDLVVPSKIGELTLSYDPNIRSEGWKYVTVYHYDIYEDHRGVVGWRWRNIGGKVDPKKNTITVPLERFGYYRVMYMYQSFDDVIAHPWARDDLDVLYSKGIMLNKGNHNFIPNDPISRGEFATLLVKIFDIPLQYTEQPTFSDVLRVNPLANGLYDYKYIETAARAGIVRGTSGNRFMPDAAITRQDAAVMIARAANLRVSTDQDRVLKSLQKEFTDANAIDIYARPSVEAVVDEGFIVGKENILLPGEKKTTYRFDPKATFTRAEAAAVAIRVMREMRKIPR